MSKIKRRGLMLVLSSPSGAGKTSIARALLAREAGLSLSVSVTTRPIRPGEADGSDYHFVDPARFEAMVAADDLLEHAEVFDHFYGTPRGEVENTLAAGIDMIFDIDWQGTQQLKQATRDDVVSVFILPPSTAELEARLRRRAEDSEEVIAGRMAKAADEMSHWAEYDYVVVNEDMEMSVDRVAAILVAERLKRHRQTGLANLVKRLRSTRT